MFPFLTVPRLRQTTAEPRTAAAESAQSADATEAVASSGKHATSGSEATANAQHVAKARSAAGRGRAPECVRCAADARLRTRIARQPIRIVEDERLLAGGAAAGEALAMDDKLRVGRRLTRDQAAIGRRRAE